MGSGEQELKLRAKLEGGEETAKGLDKISDAEKKLGEEVNATTQAATATTRVTKQATETQQKRKRRRERLPRYPEQHISGAGTIRRRAAEGLEGFRGLSIPTDQPQRYCGESDEGDHGERVGAEADRSGRRRRGRDLRYIESDRKHARRGKDRDGGDPGSD